MSDEELINKARMMVNNFNFYIDRKESYVMDGTTYCIGLLLKIVVAQHEAIKKLREEGEDE